MKKILWGSVLVMLSMNISVGNWTLGLLPDFVGYILMISGTNELLKKESSAFPVLRSVDIILKALAVGSAVAYVLDLLGIGLVSSSVEGFIWMVLVTAGDCYCWKKVIESIGRLEESYGKDFNSKLLTTAWWIYLVSGILSIAGTWINGAVLLCIIIVLTLTAPLYFIVQMYKCQKQYERAQADRK